MNDKLNEFMATKVMGWHYEKWEDDHARYCDDDSKTKFLVIDWHPDTSIEQAMMCLVNAKSSVLEIPLLWSICNGDGDSLDVSVIGVQRQVQSIKELPLAICEAIREAMYE